MSDYVNKALADALRGPNSHVTPPPPPPPVPGHYPSVDGLWFNQKVIKLDGWSFVGCRFDNCKIIIETPYFKLKNCYIGDSTQIELNGAIVNVVQLVNLSPTSSYPQYYASRNMDGTISIGV